MNELAVNRPFIGFSEKVIKELVKIIDQQAYTYISQFIVLIDANKSSFLKNKHEDSAACFIKTLWEYSLQYLLMERGDYFNLKSYSTNILRRLSETATQDYKKILLSLRQASEPISLHSLKNILRPRLARLYSEKKRYIVYSGNDSGFCLRINSRLSRLLFSNNVAQHSQRNITTRHMMSTVMNIVSLNLLRVFRHHYTFLNSSNENPRTLLPSSIKYRGIMSENSASVLNLNVQDHIGQRNDVSYKKSKLIAEHKIIVSYWIRANEIYEALLKQAYSPRVKNAGIVEQLDDLMRIEPLFLLRLYRILQNDSSLKDYLISTLANQSLYKLLISFISVRNLLPGSDESELLRAVESWSADMKDARDIYVNIIGRLLDDTPINIEILESLKSQHVVEKVIHNKTQENVNPQLIDINIKNKMSNNFEFLRNPGVLESKHFSRVIFHYMGRHFANLIMFSLKNNEFKKIFERFFAKVEVGIVGSVIYDFIKTKSYLENRYPNSSDFHTGSIYLRPRNTSRIFQEEKLILFNGYAEKASTYSNLSITELNDPVVAVHFSQDGYNKNDFTKSYILKQLLRPSKYRNEVFHYESADIFFHVTHSDHTISHVLGRSYFEAGVVPGEVLFNPVIIMRSAYQTHIKFILGLSEFKDESFLLALLEKNIFRRYINSAELLPTIRSIPTEAIKNITLSISSYPLIKDEDTVSYLCRHSNKYRLLYAIDKSRGRNKYFISLDLSNKIWPNKKLKFDNLSDTTAYFSNEWTFKVSTSTSYVGLRNIKFVLPLRHDQDFPNQPSAHDLSPKIYGKFFDRIVGNEQVISKNKLEVNLFFKEICEEFSEFHASEIDAFINLEGWVGQVDRPGFRQENKSSELYGAIPVEIKASESEIDISDGGFGQGQGKSKLVNSSMRLPMLDALSSSSLPGINFFEDKYDARDATIVFSTSVNVETNLSDVQPSYSGLPKSNSYPIHSIENDRESPRSLHGNKSENEFSDVVTDGVGKAGIQIKQDSNSKTMPPHSDIYLEIKPAKDQTLIFIEDSIKNEMDFNLNDTVDGPAGTVSGSRIIRHDDDCENVEKISVDIPKYFSRIDLKSRYHSLHPSSFGHDEFQKNKFDRLQTDDESYQDMKDGGQSSVIKSGDPLPSTISDFLEHGTGLVISLGELDKYYKKLSELFVMQNRYPFPDEVAWLGEVIDHMLSKWPDTLRKIFNGRAEQQGFLEKIIGILPESLLAKILNLLHPAEYNYLLRSGEVIAQACYGLEIEAAPRRVDFFKWKFIYEFIFKGTTPFNQRSFSRKISEYLRKNVSKKEKIDFYSEICQRIAKNILPSTRTLSLEIILVLSNESPAYDVASPPIPVGKLPSFINSHSSDNKVSGRIYIANAGQVLLASYLPRLFDKLELSEGKRFKNDEAAQRAVHLIQFMVDERQNAPEYQLVLNKLMCGIDLEEIVEREINVATHERELMEGLLQAVIANWKEIGNTSIAGLRESFLQRQGVLFLKGGTWRLQIENKAFDMLLDKLPWSYSIIKFPWMNTAIHVDWR